jgi:hypothetical protein
MLHEAFNGAKLELAPPLPIKKDPKYARYSRKLTGKYAEPLRAEEIRWIEDWARVGAPDTEIAHALDFSLKGFNEALQGAPGLLTRLTKARAAGNIEIYEALHRLGKQGNPQVLIWLSRVRLGQGKDANTQFSFASLDARLEVTQDKIEYCAMLNKAIQDAAAAQAAQAAQAATNDDAVEVEVEATPVNEPIPFPSPNSSSN